MLEDTDFGGVYIDVTIDEFNDLGFSFGDSVSIYFSTGYTLENIPYFNGYYVAANAPLIVGYPGYPHPQIAFSNGDPLWAVAELSESDTATIVLKEAGAFAPVQEAFGMSYENERGEFDSDEQFANFRALSGGALADGFFFRSASPVDDEFNRAGYVNILIEDAGVGFILDLSDSNDEIRAFIDAAHGKGTDISYFEQLFEEGDVCGINLASNFAAPAFAEGLCGGFVELEQHEGPYLVHCIEGKDRTGFVCVLLEALAGASYEELLDDYMITYDNYYGINREEFPDRYDAIANLRLREMLCLLAGVDADADLSSIDYCEPARAYLRSGGMTDEQIDTLVAILTGGGDEATGQAA